MIRRYNAAIIVLILLMTLAPSALANFDTAMTLLNPSGSNQVRVVTPLADGAYIIAGQFDKVSNTKFNRIAKINADGKIDLRFNRTTSVDGQIKKIIPVRDGKYMVVGDFTMIGSISRTRIARILSNGMVDVSFPDVKINDVVNTIVEMNDGSYVIGGDFTKIDTISSEHYLAKLNSNGQIDTDFIPVRPFPAPVKSITTTEDDNLLVVTDRDDNKVSPPSQHHLIKLSANGIIDMTFRVTAMGQIYQVQKFSGNYIIVGAFDSVNTFAQSNIVMISSTGLVNRSYDIDVNGLIDSIYLLSKDQYLIRGDFNIVGGVLSKGIAVLGNKLPILSFNNSYIGLASGSIQVGGASTNLMIELRDINNQIYTGNSDIQFSISAGSITGLRAYPNMPGRYIAKILSPDKIGSATIQVSLNNTMLLQKQNITFTAGPCDANNSTINLSPTSLIADGKSSALGLIQCRDAWTNPTSYGMTQVTSSVGVLSPLIHKGDGNYAFTITSSTDSVVGFVNLTTQTSTKSEGIRFGTICELVDIPQYECEALIDLYQNNNGINRYNQQGWLSSTDINDRYGVNAVSGHVTELDLSNNNLAGILSPSLGQLSKSTNLNLSKNLIKNADVIGLMSGLVNLDLSYNLLTRIPQILGQCRLTKLNMNYNILTSTIPAWLERCDELTDLSLSHNQMIGKLPSGLSSLKLLSHLSVDNNYFDRDYLNYALLEEPLIQVVQLNGQEQNDISVPLISNVTVTGSNAGLSYNIIFTIEENSYFSGEEDDTLITRIGGKAVLAGGVGCSSIAISPVKNHNGTTSVAAYANQNGVYMGCVLYVYDRAGNQSNGVLISPMIFNYPVLRLRLSAGEDILVESGFVINRYDQSLLQNQFEGDQLSMPRYTNDKINGHPVISFDQGRYLMGQGLVSNSLDTQINMYAVIQNNGITTDPWYSQYHNVNQLIDPLQSGSKFISVNTSSYISPDPYILHTLYDPDGINQMNVNGSMVFSTGIILDSKGTGITNTILGDFDGNIAEVMIYIDPKISFNTGAIQTYLAIKYSITQRIGFNYVKSKGSSIWDTAILGKDYSNNIFGIGKDNYFKLDQTMSANKIGMRVESPVPLVQNQYVLVGDNNGDLDRSQVLSGGNVFDRKYYLTTTMASQINLKFPISMLGSKESGIIYQLSQNEFFNTISQSGVVRYDTSSNMLVISGLNLSGSSYMRLILLEGSLDGDQDIVAQSNFLHGIFKRIATLIMNVWNYVSDGITRLFL